MNMFDALHLTVAQQTLLKALTDEKATGILVHSPAGWRPAMSGSPLGPTAWTHRTVESLWARGLLSPISAGSSMTLNAAGREAGRALHRAAWPVLKGQTWTRETPAREVPEVTGADGAGLGPLRVEIVGAQNIWVSCSGRTRAVPRLWLLANYRPQAEPTAAAGGSQ